MKKNKNSKSSKRNITNANQPAILRETVTIGRDRFTQSVATKGQLTFTLQQPLRRSARKPSNLTITDISNGLVTTVSGRHLTSLKTLLTEG